MCTSAEDNSHPDSFLGRSLLGLALCSGSESFIDVQIIEYVTKILQSLISNLSMKHSKRQS